MIQSALWILLILLAVYLADRWIDHYLAETGTGAAPVCIRFAP